MEKLSEDRGLIKMARERRKEGERTKDEFKMTILTTFNFFLKLTSSGFFFASSIR